MGYHQTSETLRDRVQRLHECRGAHYGCSKNGDPSARSRIPETICTQPEPARAETETETRFPRPCRLTVRRRTQARAGQFRVGKALAGDLRNGKTESLRIVHVLPIVVAESLFVDVAEEMIGFHADVGSVQSALQQAPKVLHRVCVNIAVDVFDGVIDDGVLVVGLQAVIGLQFVAEDRGSGFDPFPDQGFKVSPLAAVYMTSNHLPAALDHPEHNFLTLRAAAGDDTLTLRRVHVSRFATDKGFVYFDFAGEFAAIFVLQRKPNPMEHVPCTLLSDSERAVNLPRANAILHIGLHPDCGKPLVQTERGILHDGPDFHGKLGLEVTALALPQATGSDVPYILRSAGRADNAVLPFRPMRQEIANAVVRVGKVDDCILKCPGFACHRHILRQVS